MYNERFKVRQLSPVDRRNAEIAARKQALAEARQRTRPQSIPHQEIADDLGYGDDEEWEPPRMPTVTRRYDLAPGEYYHQTPLRRSAPVTQAPAPRRQVHVHWFVYVGIALILLLIGWMASGPITTAWQTHTDDVTYGMPRTYQTDAVVGHNDSKAHPSHFTAENLKGIIFVTEYPGGDITKARVYLITTTNNDDPTVPARVTFEDTRGSGKLDMVVVIGDPGAQVTITRYNDGSTFDGKP